MHQKNAINASQANDSKPKLFTKDVVLLLQGNAFSFFGDILYNVAIAFWVYEQTGSTAIMGIVASINLLVSMFLTPFSGVIIDRSNRKFWIAGTDFIRSGLMFMVAYFAFQEHLSVPIVLITAFSAALCSVFFGPAATTVLADIVPASLLIRGQSINQGMMSLLAMIGKAISGLMLTHFGVPLMILLNAISFLISAVSELFIRVPKNPKEGTPINAKQILIDVKEGAIETYRNPSLRKIIPLVIFLNLLASGMNALYLPFVMQKGFDVTQYGYLMSVFSFAGIIGMVIMSIVQFPVKQRHLIMGYGFFFGLAFHIVGYLSINFYVMAGGFFVGSLLMAMGNAVANALLILGIPKDKRGGMIGFVIAASTGGSAISSIIYGLIAERFPLYLIASVGTLLAMIPAVILANDKTIKNMFFQIEEASETAEQETTEQETTGQEEVPNIAV